MTFSQEGRRFRAIAWRAAERAAFLDEHRAGVNLAFSLDQNEFQGETYLELTVADIKALDDVIMTAGSPDASGRRSTRDSLDHDALAESPGSR